MITVHILFLYKATRISRRFLCVIYTSPSYDISYQNKKMKTRNIAGLYDMIQDYIDKNLEQILIDRENEARKLLREFESDRKSKDEEG